MKFTIVASALAMAATAIAAPAEVEARTGGGGGGSGGGSCSSTHNKQVCCNGLLSCAVQVIGSNCNSNAYCCSTGAPVGALVNIALLNCVDIL
ncbi:hydrophobin 3 precursor [Fusarium albosuccineum]|uniref:Hydrophobin 3 n=1 Tax=Fusarium albosuccineum TaxID=1237068 RepID=A0A8H4PFJ5_9HYPO|nr:hydrophobin 3 precursor [Fusarium albosuccineum]